MRPLTSTLLFGCAGLLLNGPALATDLTGSWKVFSERYGQRSQSYLTLTQNGNTLTAADPCMSAIEGIGIVRDSSAKLVVTDNNHNSTKTWITAQVKERGLRGTWLRKGGTPRLPEHGGWFAFRTPAPPTASECVVATIMASEGNTCTWGTPDPSVPQVHISFSAEPGTIVSVDLEGDKVNGPVTASTLPNFPREWMVAAGVTEVGTGSYGTYYMTLHFADGSSDTFEVTPTDSWFCLMSVDPR